MESPSLEVFKRHLSVSLGVWFRGDYGGGGWIIVKVSSNLDDSVIPSAIPLMQ